MIRSKSIARGSRPRKQRKGSRAALKRRCDRLWSLLVRQSNGGRCKLAGMVPIRCGGVLQAAHCFGRGHNGVRHELWNGWPLCAGKHVYYTHHPEAWNALLRAEWGDAIYESRYAQAIAIAKPNYEAIEAELLEAAKQVGVA